MTVKVQVGPPQIAIHQGQTVLVTEPDGQIKWPSEKGLYFFDTRLISAWAIYANGASWELLNGGAVSYDAARIHLANRVFRSEAGTVPARTIGLVLARWIEGGLHEDLDITNHGPKPVHFNLEIAVRCDFADIFEVKSDAIVRRGRIATEWSDAEQRLSNTYRNDDFSREVAITPHAGEHRAVYANGRLVFPVALGPGETWHCCLLYDLADGERRFPATERCEHDRRHGGHAYSLAEWRKGVLSLRTSNEEFYRFFHQAVDDMAALRLPLGGTDAMSFVPAAGL